MKPTIHSEQGRTFIESMIALNLEIENELLPWKPDICPSREDMLVRKGLGRLGIPIKRLKIDPAQYQNYMDRALYRKRQPDCYRKNFVEKTVEHFIGLRILQPERGEVFVDIGGSGNPVADIFSDLSGCDAFSQDRIYEPGLNQRRIGCDAADIPLPNSFVDKALASCTIEHFEGITDILWMKEMARLLKDNGKCVVAPLYLNSFAYCVTDPMMALSEKVKFDEGIKVYARKNFANRHGRHYSPESLFERLIKSNRSSLDFLIYLLDNGREIDPSVYCKYILVVSKKGMKTR